VNSRIIPSTVHYKYHPGIIVIIIKLLIHIVPGLLCQVCCALLCIVQQRKVAGEVSGADREKEIVLEAERLEIRDKAPLVLAELLYDTNIITQIKQYRTLFCRVCYATS